MDRLSSFVLAHRRWIFAFWVVTFVAGIAAAGAVPNRLSYDFSLPGQQGYETEQKIIASYEGVSAIRVNPSIERAVEPCAVADRALELVDRDRHRLDDGR